MQTPSATTEMRFATTKRCAARQHKTVTQFARQREQRKATLRKQRATERKCKQHTRQHLTDDNNFEANPIEANPMRTTSRHMYVREGIHAMIAQTPCHENFDSPRTAARLARMACLHPTLSVLLNGRMVAEVAAKTRNAMLTLWTVKDRLEFWKREKGLEVGFEAAVVDAKLAACKAGVARAKFEAIKARQTEAQVTDLRPLLQQLFPEAGLDQPCFDALDTALLSDLSAFRSKFARTWRRMLSEVHAAAEDVSLPDDVSAFLQNRECYYDYGEYDDYDDSYVYDEFDVVSVLPELLRREVQYHWPSALPVADDVAYFVRAFEAATPLCALQAVSHCVTRWSPSDGWATVELPTGGSGPCVQDSACLEAMGIVAYRQHRQDTLWAAVGTVRLYYNEAGRLQRKQEDCSDYYSANDLYHGTPAGDDGRHAHGLLHVWPLHTLSRCTDPRTRRAGGWGWCHWRGDEVADGGLLRARAELRLLIDAYRTQELLLSEMAHNSHYQLVDDIAECIGGPYPETLANMAVAHRGRGFVGWYVRAVAKLHWELLRRAVRVRPYAKHLLEHYAERRFAMPDVDVFEADCAEVLHPCGSLGR